MQNANQQTKREREGLASSTNKNAKCFGALQTGSVDVVGCGCGWCKRGKIRFQQKEGHISKGHISKGILHPQCANHCVVKCMNLNNIQNAQAPTGGYLGDLQIHNEVVVALAEVDERHVGNRNEKFVDTATFRDGRFQSVFVVVLVLATNAAQHRQAGIHTICWWGMCCNPNCQSQSNARAETPCPRKQTHASSRTTQRSGECGCDIKWICANRNGRAIVASAVRFACAFAFRTRNSIRVRISHFAFHIRIRICTQTRIHIRIRICICVRNGNR